MTQQRFQAHEGKPGHNPRFRGNPGNRSQKSVNLRRLVNALDFDMTAAALGVRESTLQALLEGRGDWEQYLPHISPKLVRAGLPGNWLERHDAPLRAEHIAGLRNNAAASEEKAPTRRDNFKQLMRLFDDKLSILADALEVTESSMHAVAEGRLVLDEQRFGHLNPRLMRAGFPDAWLDLPSAPMQPEWKAGLTSLAEEAYEDSYEPQATPATAHATPELIVANPATNVNPPSEGTQVQLELTESAAESSTAVDEVSPASESTDIEAQPESHSGQIHQEHVMVATQTNSVKPPSKTESKSTTPSAPPVRPASFSGAPAGLPRGAMSAGRAIDPSKAPAVKNAKPRAASASAAQGTAAVSPVATKAPKTHRVPPTGNSAPVLTQPPATAPRKRGKGTAVSREQSVARAEALEKLLDSARRGAKVCLWRDLMGKSLPYWANIKRGNINFNEEMANEVTEHLGLPYDWLDKPEFPPAKLASWVMDASVPLPVVGKDARNKADAGAETEAEATASEPAEQAATPAKVKPTVTSGVPGMPKPFARKTAATQVAQNVVPTTPPALPSIAAVEQPAPQAATTQPVAAAGLSGFVWQPKANATRRESPSPMVGALKSVLDSLSTAGTFSDEDATRLIHMLTSAQ